MDRLTKGTAIAVGAMALVATSLLGAVAVPGPAPRAAALSTYDSLAAEYGVTIDWFEQQTNLCDDGASGCIDFESVDSINVMSGQTNEWTTYVVLHEIGHVLQYRNGGRASLNECAADHFALSNGAMVAGYDC